MRSYYSLRSAIDEKFVPRAVRNLNIISNFVFLILLALGIVYFVLQIYLLEIISINIKNIHYSERRINYLIDINLRIRTLIIIQRDENIGGYVNDD